MAFWHVTVRIPRLTGESVREVNVLASSRREAHINGVEHLRKQEPTLFEPRHLEGVPRATANRARF